MRSGANLPGVGDFNQTVVLDTIRRTDGISRVELAEHTGLRPQTVSNIVRRLLEEELVTESGRLPSSGGKPRTQLSLNPAAYYAVGVQLDPDETSYVVCDLAGTLVARTRRRTNRSGNPTRIIAGIVKAVRDLLDRSAVPPERVLGIGVASPGPIDPERGSVVEPPNLPGWHEVLLRDVLAGETGLPVLIDNDATAAAIGERWAGGGARAGSFLFVYVGTGIGGGLVLRDQVYRGNTGNACEVGHVTVVPGGHDCFCGNRGCLEAYCSPRAMVAEARELLDAGEPSSLRLSGAQGRHSRLSQDYENLCRSACEGDPLATSLVERAAEKFAQAVTGLVNILDIDLVVLGGKSLRHIDSTYRAALERGANERPIARDVRRVRVESSLFGEDVGAVGAAALVLHDTYTPRLSTLLGTPAADGQPAR